MMVVGSWFYVINDDIRFLVFVINDGIRFLVFVIKTSTFMTMLGSLVFIVTQYKN